MWRFLGGLAFGAGLGAVVSAFISVPQPAYSDVGNDQGTFHILHQVTRLDRLEDDQLMPVASEKPSESAQVAATNEKSHHKHVASVSKTASSRQIKSRVVDRHGTGDQPGATQAMAASAQVSGAARNSLASNPFPGDETARGSR
jgi:hypothetical protein